MLRFVLCFLASAMLFASGTRAAALDRSAFTFTSYDLHARLTPAEQGFEVRGHVTLRNDSAAPQRNVALQVSSTLTWQSIQLGGKPATYVTGPYTTDIDHTGSVSEAIVTLPAPVAPKGVVELEVVYSGTIPQDTTRLTRIGTPAETAAQSDWDHMSEAFSAVRGVGYVCWYPVAMEAANLSEGSDLFAVLGEWKSRHAAATMKLALQVLSDKLVITNGRLISQKASSAPQGTLHERQYEFIPMGLFPPTFVIGDYTLLNRPVINVFHLPDHEAGAQEFVVAAEKQARMITDWQGRQRQKVVVVELPANSAPFDSGAILFSPITSTDRRIVEVTIAHQLAHACLESPRPWVVEGLAHFVQALVREGQDGRKAALAYLQQFRPALVEAEKQTRPAAARAAAPGKAPAGAASSPAAPSGTPTTGKAAAATAESNSMPAATATSGEGQPLIRATDDVYYRSKALFVWWMLRDMLGDEVLQRALQQYHGEDDREASYVQRLVEGAARQRLEWFFDEWVYRDRGLPDFRIDAVNTRPMLPEGVTVSVTVVNDGDAGAEVPVRAPTTGGDAVQRILVPARGKATLRLNAAAVPGEVIVNDGSVPEMGTGNNTFKVNAE